MTRFVLSLMVLLPALGCAEAPASTLQTSSVQSQVSTFDAVDVRGLHTLLADGEPVVLDVRTPEEFAAGHPPGAVNIPLQQLSDRMAELAPLQAEALYVSCRTSNRSRVASELLTDAGFQDVVQVLGGFSAWNAAGYEVER